MQDEIVTEPSPEIEPICQLHMERFYTIKLQHFQKKKKKKTCSFKQKLVQNALSGILNHTIMQHLSMALFAQKNNAYPMLQYILIKQLSKDFEDYSQNSVLTFFNP